jgi:hypothetical protein
MTEKAIDNQKNIELENFLNSFDLPACIDTSYPSISIGDLEDIADIIVPGVDSEITAELEVRLQEIKQAIAPSDIDSSFYYISSRNLATPLEAIADEEVKRTDCNVGIVHLDKFIGLHQNHPNFTRLNISRNPDNKLVSRVGTKEDPEQQLTALVSWAKHYAIDEMIFIDDVVAFGSTLPPLLNRLRAELPQAEFRILAGIAASGGTWRGIEKIQEETGIEVEYLTKALVSPKVEGSSSGLAIPVSRDLTLFGGKAGQKEDGTPLSYPYFLPFSKPLPSLIASDKVIESAVVLHDFNMHLCATLQSTLGRELIVGDLIERGLGVPVSSLECLKGKMRFPHSQTPLLEYLKYTREVFEDNVDIVLEECGIRV